MKHTLRLFALLVITVSSVAWATAPADHPYTEIDAKALQELRANTENLVVIDSRGGKYFDGTMIEGAVNLSAQDTTAESLASIVPTKDTPIVFYCTNTSCPASMKSAFKAREAGYTVLYKYPGGIEDWVSKGLPTISVETDAAEEAESTTENL